MGHRNLASRSVLVSLSKVDCKMTSRKFPPFFGLSFLILFFVLFCAVAAQSKFGWLKPGCYAVYTLGTYEDEEISNLMKVGFDDCAWTRHLLGNYSWRCIGRDDGYARLEVEFNATVIEAGFKPFTDIPRGHVEYIGREFYDKAYSGDLSFVKRIPVDQFVERMELYAWEEEEFYSVEARAPIHIYKKIEVTVDLDTLELVDEYGLPWGKWALWIDTVKYPLNGTTREMLMMNWLNTTVYTDITYLDKFETIDTIFGTYERFFQSWPGELKNDFLNKLSWESSFSYPVYLNYAYEPRVGILLESLTWEYLDDVLTQKFGAVFTLGEFKLVETNISIDEPNGFDLSPYIPHLAVLGITATIAAAYFIKKMK
jgi:hypothetical protein